MQRLAGPVHLYGLGLLVLVAVWVLAVPPFRGADEFEHAYRSAGVASGQWQLTEASPYGDGQLVDVPPELAEAAAPQCAAMPYKKPAECRGSRVGDVQRVTTTAGSYNPAAYALLGAAGRLGEGAASLYAMRAGAALASWLMIVAGLCCLVSVRVRPVVWLAVVAGLTPAFVYSLAVAAPNGIEMAAGFGLWAALLGLVGARASSPWGRQQTGMVVLATVSATVLVTVRSLGPLWAVAIALTVLAFSGASPVRTRCRQRPWLVAGAAAVVLAATVASMVWTLGSGLVAAASSEAAPQPVDIDRGPYGEAPVHAWYVQAIAAFPYREQVPNPAIHLMVGLVMGVLVVMALRRGSTINRRGLVLGLLVSVAVPLALAVATSDSQAAEWQGRYGLPFLVGLPLLAGMSVQEAAWRSRFGAVPMVALALAMLAAAQVWSVVTVQRAEAARAVSAGDSAWVHPHLAGTALLALVGCVCCSLAVAASRRAA